MLRTGDRARSPALHGYSLQVTHGSTLDLGGANLVSVGKINANLYDPVYRIEGAVQATDLPETPEPLVERCDGPQPTVIRGAGFRLVVGNGPPRGPAAYTLELQVEEAE